MRWVYMFAPIIVWDLLNHLCWSCLMMLLMLPCFVVFCRNKVNLAIFKLCQVWCFCIPFNWWIFVSLTLSMGRQRKLKFSYYLFVMVSYARISMHWIGQTMWIQILAHLLMHNAWLLVCFHWRFFFRTILRWHKR